MKAKNHLVPAKVKPIGSVILGVLTILAQLFWVELYQTGLLLYEMWIYHGMKEGIPTMGNVYYASSISTQDLEITAGMGY